MIAAIVRRELRLLFSPTILLVAAAFHLWNGLVWRHLVKLQLEAARTAGVAGGVPELGLSEAVLAPLFLGLAFGLVLFVPLVTMRSLTEERRSGYEDVLASLPVGSVSVVTGKFLATLVLVAFLALPPILLVLPMAGAAPIELGVVVAGAVGILLAAAAYAAVGTWASSQFGNPVGAGGVALMLLLFLFLVDGFWARGATFSLRTAIEPFAHGVLSTRAVVLHLVVAGLFLFLAVNTWELRRRTR